MENSMAKDVITQMYAEFKLYHHYIVENWGILCSALGCAVEALEKQIPKKVILGYDEHDSICCPNCKRELMSMDWYDHWKCNYCEVCGQALDWGVSE